MAENGNRGQGRGSHDGVALDKAFDALEEYCQDPDAVWKRETHRPYLRAIEGSLSAEITRFGELSQGLELRHGGEDITERFSTFLEYFSLDDEVGTDGPTGRTQHEAAWLMIVQFRAELAKHNTSLPFVARQVWEASVLIQMVDAKRYGKPPYGSRQPLRHQPAPFRGGDWSED